MVIDTSAIVAILLDETERARFNRLIEDDDVRLISAVTRVDSAFVIEGRRREVGRVALANLLSQISAEIVAVTPAQAELACEAFHRYGKGRHRAGLNFGDSCSYALAKSTVEKLLFKGTDFGSTDIEVAA